MKINPDIFKAYDIRGIYPEELDEEASYLIGRAYIQFLKKKKPKIVVGQDNRLSSPSLFEALTLGMVEQGADVVDIGLATSPLLYWTCAFFEFDGGINITASHNGAQYNGFKVVREKAIPISEKSGIKEIKKLVLEGKFKTEISGEITKKETLKEYIQFNKQNFDFKKIKPLEIVIDTANAVSGIVIPEIFQNTNCQIYHIFSELEGTFLNHQPDPLKKENLKDLSATVKARKADFGVGFDGDGDRVIFVDEKGDAVGGDMITALMAEMILKKNQGEKILYDIRSSNSVKETIEREGGKALIERIGHSYIKERMRKEKAIFGGELSGHYYHRDHFFCECPFFVIFKILEKLSQESKPFSEIISPFRKYFSSGEINFKVKDKEKILKLLEKNPPGGGERGKIMKLDGLRIDFKDWWFLVRPSNTEPLLRLVIEAKSKELVYEKAHLLSDVLNG